MAITEDTTAPPVIHFDANAATQTTASFTPASGTLIVVLVSAGTFSGSFFTVTDSAGGTWALRQRASNTSSPNFSEVWFSYVASGSARTVTATFTPAGGTPYSVTVVTKCLLGADPVQAGAVASSLTANSASIAAGTGNMVYGMDTVGATLTVLGNTTTVDTWVDSGNFSTHSAFRSTSATAGTATYGYSTAGGSPALAAAEVVALGGGGGAVGPTPVNLNIRQAVNMSNTY